MSDDYTPTTDAVRELARLYSTSGHERLPIDALHVILAEHGAKP